MQKTDPIFMFENAWFLREGIDKIVHDVWNDPSISGDSVDRLLGKFRLLRPKLKDWKRNMSARYTELKKYIMIRLDIIDKHCEKMVIQLLIEKSKWN